MAGRLGREADDEPGRLAAKVACRWRSRLTDMLGRTCQQRLDDKPVLVAVAADEARQSARNGFTGLLA